MGKEIKKLQELAIKFRDDRDWKKYHKPKDVVVSAAIEIAELLERFQWKTDKEINLELATGKKKEIEEEIADVIIYLLYLANDLNIDLEKAIKDKIRKNSEKYPIEKIKGNYKKYTEL